jgi:hypothetical protein
MNLTKREFGIMLQSKLRGKVDLVHLSQWAFQVYLDHCRNLEPGLKELLLDLGRMADAPEFEYSIEELSNLASQMLLGH